MRRILHVIVAYDVSSDRERAQVDRVLKGYGFRVQKSVFDVKTDQAGLRHLIDELSALSLKTGQALFYRLNQCTKVIAIGETPESTAQTEDAAFVI